MPATTFKVKWPDGTEQGCYSPSTIVKDFFELNHNYTVDEFAAISEKALNAASERVLERFGYACSSAMDQLAEIKIRCAEYGPDAGNVVVTSIE